MMMFIRVRVQPVLGLLFTALFLCVLVPGAAAGECGKEGRALLDSRRAALEPLLAAEVGAAEPSGKQVFATLRLSDHFGCEGLLGYEARALKLHVRLSQGEVHALLPEIRELSSDMEADTATTEVELLVKLRDRLRSSGRLASSIKLSLPSSGDWTEFEEGAPSVEETKTSRPQLYEKDGPVQVLIRVLDAKGSLVTDLGANALKVVASSGTVQEMKEGPDGPGSFAVAILFFDDSLDTRLEVEFPDLKGSFPGFRHQDEALSFDYLTEKTRAKRARQAELERTQQEELKREQAQQKRRQAGQTRAIVVIEIGLVSGASVAGVLGVVNWEQARSTGDTLAAIGAGEVPANQSSEDDVDLLFEVGDWYAQNARTAVAVAGGCLVSAAIVAIIHVVKTKQKASSLSSDSGRPRVRGVGLGFTPNVRNDRAPGLAFTFQGEW